MDAVTEPRKLTFVAAFAAVYFIWGSTYLAIRLAVESIPPFFMLASRFGLAGLIFYFILRLRGAPRPPLAQWRSATAVGGMMLCVGTGAVAWSEQHISSGLAALLVTTVPLWMVLLEWRQTRKRPGRAVFFGLMLGLVGVTVLFDPFGNMARTPVETVSILLLLLGCVSWSLGSIFSRTAALPESPAMATALEMLMGGLCLTVLGFLTGEGSRFDPAAITTNSLLAWLYLFLFGSFIAFGSYIWLLKNATPTRASSYAFVNPVVAVVLGALVAGEAFTQSMAVGTLLMITAVVLVVLKPRTRLAPVAPETTCPHTSS